MLSAFNSRLHSILAYFSGKRWFPQVPLSLAVALLGLLHLIPVVDQALGLQLHFRTPGSIRQDLFGVSLSGISQMAISVLLLWMSIGLWKRSRLAWVLTLLLAIAGLVSMIRFSWSGVGLLAYDIVMLALLLLTRRDFDRSGMGLGTLTALAVVLVLFGYAVFGTYVLGGQFSPKIDNLTDALYLSVVTMSTVGFGDFTPATPEARLFLVSIIILSISVFSTAVGATLIPAMVHKFEQISFGRHSRVTRKDHYIIVGYSALSNNTYRELMARGEQVTVILKQAPDATQFSGSDVDAVIGDGSDLKILREAGGEHAKGILALLDDDSENAFVILAAKELHTKAKTVAAVNEAKHLNRIRRVHPDLIIAPQVLGGELLTSVLTGERIDVKDIMGRLLGQSSAKSQPEKTG